MVSSMMLLIVLIFCWSFFFFFFSSRRRHTRFDCDWSSDVCSSDLDHPAGDEQGQREADHRRDHRPRRAHADELRAQPDLRHAHRDQRPVERLHQPRSEEHTSELQSQSNLVCRLLLEKKKKKTETKT